jgi:hypothetical protein
MLAKQEFIELENYRVSSDYSFSVRDSSLVSSCPHRPASNAAKTAKKLPSAPTAGTIEDCNKSVTLFYNTAIDACPACIR